MDPLVFLDGTGGLKMDAIRVEIAKLLIRTEAELQDLVLIEREGSRVIHMSIGLFEAAAIRRRLANEPVSRPQTHDLLENTITALDARPHHVLIRHEDNGVFFADLVLEASSWQHRAHQRELNLEGSLQLLNRKIPALVCLPRFLLQPFL